MAELLLELLSEEIPARMQKRAAEDLKRLVIEGLAAANLDVTSAAAYVTPRRLTLVVNGLPDKQPDLREERKGPRVGAPDKAIEGFLRGAGFDSLDQCEKRDTGKGEVWFAVTERAGKPTRDVFPELLNNVFTKFPWQKSMRWGMETQSWVRPVQGILCIFEGAVVEGISFNDQSSADTTVGHRFLAPPSITVTSFADYKQKLRDAHVMLDTVERRAVIEAGLTEQAAAEGLSIKDDPALLDEVAGLVEWPVPLLGDIDADFMALPGEALTSSMRAHQKYFSLLNGDGTLAPRFGFVANMAAADGGAAIIAGNERVLRARLSDAKFFWDRDREFTLKERLPALDAIVFHAKLGTVAEKVYRITALATDLVDNIPGAERAAVRSAATLCKADLVTGMVAEFPDLQGVMGRYYALGEGEALEVADAIAEHYSPRGPNDACPTAPVSVAVAMADKIDTLVGFWAIDEKPTGSGDPFALRRAALGLIRLIMEGELRLDLTRVFLSSYTSYLRDMDRSVVLYNKNGFDNPQHKLIIAKAHTLFLENKYDQVLIGKSRNITGPGSEIDYVDSDFISKFRPHDVVISELSNFIVERLKILLREHDISHDVISAVFAEKRTELDYSGSFDLNRIIKRARALKRFLSTGDGENLLVAYRRAANILRVEEKKDGTIYQPGLYNDQMSEGDELALSIALEDVSDKAIPLISAENFHEGMDCLSKLRLPVDKFFENVTVNAKAHDLRKNRLQLLAKIKWTMELVADFSQIEG